MSTQKRGQFIPFGFDDRVWVEELIESARLKTGHKNSTKLAVEVMIGIAAAAIRGNKRAQRVFRAVAVEGLRRFITELDRAKKNALPLPDTNEVVEINEVYAIRALDQHGLQMSFWEREQWSGMKPPTFLRMVRTQRAQYTKLGLKVRGWDRIVPIVLRHPDAQTVREAIILDGKNPGDYGMREAS